MSYGIPRERHPISELRVDGDFENGRIEVVSVDREQKVITTRVPDDDHTQNPQMRFWQMRLTGVVPGEEITIRHTPSVEMHYVFSYDGEHWQRFAEPGIENVTHAFEETTVYIAPNIPYPYSRSLRLAESLTENPFVTVSDLALSEEGRAVKLFRVTDDAVEENEKRVLWIQGRQHAFESPSSFPPEGLLRWMSSGDAEAVEFRKWVVAYVVPIMDVDHVFHGMSGKDMPHDFNRSWEADPCPWNAIAAVKNRLQSLKQQGASFLGFVDSHDPYFVQEPQWYVAGSSESWQQFDRCFVDAVRRAGGKNRHGMDLEQPILSVPPADTQRGRDFAWSLFQEVSDFLALTLESPHHKDSDGVFMTEEGYLQWGEALGRAFLNYLISCN
ncbi:M14 family zinc carboxypeptidase [Kiritimatiellaeota bacterium B1221]|nr:M14 family zinc carboxypeptidase [Kiritimatiellaeota bacterium B1221]